MKILVNLLLLLTSTVLLRSALPAYLPARSFVPVTDEEKEAASILERMREVYDECESYSDEGESRTVFLRPIEGQTRKRKRTVVKPFETIFQRPGQFRFEFRDRRGEEEWNRYVVWQDDERESHSYWTVKEQLRHWPSLERGLGAATGVSDSTSRNVPWLLLGKRNWIQRMQRFELVGEDEIEGHPCWKVVGYPEDSARVSYPVSPPVVLKGVERPSTKPAEPGVTTLWIDRDSYLLRRIHSTRQFEKFSTERTITYRPIMGEPIPDSAFVMNPTK